MSIRPLPKELQEKVKSELNEVTNRIEEDLNNVKQWLLKQPHLQFIAAGTFALNYFSVITFM